MLLIRLPRGKHITTSGAATLAAAPLADLFGAKNYFKFCAIAIIASCADFCRFDFCVAS